MLLFSATAYKGQLFINNEKFTIQGSLLRVQLRVSYNDDVLNNGEMLNFTPVLKNGFQSQALSSVVINSKERLKYENRKDYFNDLVRTNVPVVTKDPRHGTRYFIYDTTIPYNDWMRNASLYIESEERGWGRTPHVYEDQVFKKIVLNTVPTSTSDFTVDEVFVNGGSSAKAEWVQFLDPTNVYSSELSLSGSYSSYG